MTEKQGKAEPEGKLTWPCAVCKKPTESAAPLTICEDCKKKPEAEIVRLKYSVFFWKTRANHYSDEIDALEIALEAKAQAQSIEAVVIESLRELLHDAEENIIALEGLRAIEEKRYRRVSLARQDVQNALKLLKEAVATNPARSEKA